MTTYAYSPNLNTMTLMATYMNNLLNGDAPLDKASSDGESGVSKPDTNSKSTLDVSASDSYDSGYESAKFSETTRMETAAPLSQDTEEPKKAEKSRGSDKPNLTPTKSTDASDNANSKVTGKQPIYDKGWFRPALIGTGLTIFMVGGAALMLGGGDEQQTTLPAGSANAAEIDPAKDGRDSLNTEQARYIAQQEQLKTQKEAQEGVTNTVILTNPEANVSENTYLDENVSSMISVTKGQQDIPRTLVQLRADPNLTEYEDEDGLPIFKHNQTGMEYSPVENSMKKHEALYNTNNQSPNGGGYSNQDYNGGGSGTGGSGQQTASFVDENNPRQDSNEMSFVEYQRQQMNQQPQSQPVQQQNNYSQQEQYSQQLAQRPRDSYLDTARESLRAEYEVYAQESNDTEAMLAERQNQFSESRRELLQDRRASAQQSFGEGVSSLRERQGSGGNNKSGFSSLSYFKKADNAGEEGGAEGGSSPYNSIDNGANATANGFNKVNYTSNNVTLSPTGELVNESSQQSTGTGGNGSNMNLTPDGRLPRNILRAGTQMPVIITNSVNTDEGTRVTGEIVYGKFAGSKVYGTVYQTSRSIGIRFDRIAPPNPRKPLIPINAIATTLGSGKEAVATDVKRHYLQNYGVKAMGIGIESYGTASNEKGKKTLTYIDPNGNPITIEDNTDDNRSEGERFRAELTEQLGSQLREDISQLGNRPTTYYVAQGTVVSMVLSTNLDINGTASDIAFGSQR